MDTRAARSERLDVDADGTEVLVAGVDEEADDAGVVLHGQAEALPPQRAAVAERPVGSEVGDERQARDAVVAVVGSVLAVNLRHELRRPKLYRGGLATGAAPVAGGVGQLLAIAVGEAEAVDDVPMVHGDSLQAQRRYCDVTALT